MYVQVSHYLQGITFSASVVIVKKYFNLQAEYFSILTDVNNKYNNCEINNHNNNHSSNINNLNNSNNNDDNSCNNKSWNKEMAKADLETWCLWSFCKNSRNWCQRLFLSNFFSKIWEQTRWKLFSNCLEIKKNVDMICSQIN